ncbi:chitin-binding type-2 domain-containing protein [Trichonephila clavata]|uniref:Chitin-binding type-2 domain-containing protein n=1 Tax=Trichonephila clavata TaxID=2740835 RepID=A0A8X6FRF9_TRICU|nr:chitin-binding type-2 domain-containing protein [Trichonephila clavata]
MGASSSRQQKSFRQAKLAIAALPEDTDDDGIPGESAVDYPTYRTIPKTPFSCAQQQHNGYYADLDTSCQVVHLCQAGGVKSSFLCPNGTIFNQEKFSCQWWYKVNCADAPKFYAINDNLYKTPEDKKSS